MFKAIVPFSEPYSAIDEFVSYEKGLNLEQWTIRFVNMTANQFALIKLRFSKLFKEQIEIDVELS